MRVCVCLCVGKGRHIWLFIYHTHIHTHTRFSWKLCRASKHKSVQFSMAEFFIRQAYTQLNPAHSTSRLSSDIHGRTLFPFCFLLLYTHIHTSMIYVVFNFGNRCDNTTHTPSHTLCMCMYDSFSLFFEFFLLLLVVRPFWFLVWFGSNLQIKRTSRETLQINSLVNRKLCKTHLSCAIFVQSLLLDMF